jgi:hypothetical protein
MGISNEMFQSYRNKEPLKGNRKSPRRNKKLLTGYPKLILKSTRKLQKTNMRPKLVSGS